MRGSRESGGRDRAWWARPLTLILSVGFLAAAASGGVLVYEVEKLDDASENQILPGAVVNGVDLAGMSRSEAVDALRETVADEMDRTVTLELGDKQTTVTPRELGAQANVEQVVDAALEDSRNASWETLASIRFLGAEMPYRATASVRYPKKQIRQFVMQSASELRTEPESAELTHTDTNIEVTEGEVGRAIAAGKTVEAMRNGLRDGRDVIQAVGRRLEPERTAEDYSQVLLLRQGDRQLDYYVDGELVGTYTVAVGTGGHPTPTGTYTVSLKRPSPTWVNPAPNGWGAGMPESIGPGPNNPLGLRALNWSAPAYGIRFHGTANISSLGQAASHGCVRLSNEDIVELYDKVDEGAIIVSTY